MERRPNGNAAYYWIGGIIIVLLALGIWFFNRTPDTDVINNETNTSTSTGTSAAVIQPYGSITLKIGESATFRGITITPIKVEEDSRCAADVQCVWAGTVKVSVKSELSNGAISTNMVTLGQKTTVDTFAVGLTSVTPAKASTTAIAQADYRLTFDVHQASVVDEELIGK
ncbi:MAG TPA: hypothetical protein VGE35_02715 [Candidatus Paceibacterota bacterium]